MGPEPPLASVPRRVIAYGLDIAIIFVAVVAVQGLVSPVNPLLGSDPAVSGAALHAWVTLTVTVPIVLYLGLFWASRWGASPGMRVLGLQVRSADSGGVTTTRALVRALVLLLPFELNHAVLFHPRPIWDDPTPGFRVGFVAVYALLGVYLVVTLWSSQRQGPHDLAAGTIVTAQGAAD